MFAPKRENPLDKMSRGFYNAVVHHRTSRACTAVKFMDREMVLPVRECCLHVCGLGSLYHGGRRLSIGGVKIFLFFDTRAERARSGAPQAQDGAARSEPPPSRRKNGQEGGTEREKNTGQAPDRVPKRRSAENCTKH